MSSKSENLFDFFQALEKERDDLGKECSQLQTALERLNKEKRLTEEYLSEAQHSAAQLLEDKEQLLDEAKREADARREDQEMHKKLVEELGKEVGNLSIELIKIRAGCRWD